MRDLSGWEMVSFVREHNLFAVNVADGKEHALTMGGTEEIRKGELDWVYPEELGNRQRTGGRRIRRQWRFGDGRKQSVEVSDGGF